MEMRGGIVVAETSALTTASAQANSGIRGENGAGMPKFKEVAARFRNKFFPEIDGPFCKVSERKLERATNSFVRSLIPTRSDYIDQIVVDETGVHYGTTRNPQTVGKKIGTLGGLVNMKAFPNIDDDYLPACTFAFREPINGADRMVMALHYEGSRPELLQNKVTIIFRNGEKDVVPRFYTDLTNLFLLLKDFISNPVKFIDSARARELRSIPVKYPLELG